MAESIRDRLARVEERICAAASRVGRAPSSVRLVAVSKMMPVDVIRQALDAGIRTLGENRVQEATAKIPLLPPLAAWHLVGHLQTNKAKPAVQLFEMIHSLDSLRLARELDKHGRQSGKVVRCLIEVNLGGEESKSGTGEEGVRPLLEAARDLRSLRVEGLMAVPPFLTDPEAVRPFFRRLRTLRDKLETEGWQLPELSMGMTHDFEVAIEEGATMVRIGTAIFGPRPA
ncbi:MAG TPA: YggS family pyridoxal phosphate-dependent enzyme [Candidatus Methylomirabilis sp.]|nr:YggS family pyridoxal phosphate-dependent enzyme [Candidatus Methylomirabilis sp.]